MENQTMLIVNHLASVLNIDQLIATTLADDLLKQYLFLYLLRKCTDAQDSVLIGQNYLKDIGLFELSEMSDADIVWVTIPESSIYIFGILNTPSTCRTTKVFLFLMESSMSGVEAYLFHSCDAYGLNKNSFIIHVRSLLMMLQPDRAVYYWNPQPNRLSTDKELTVLINPEPFIPKCKDEIGLIDSPKTARYWNYEDTNPILDKLMDYLRPYLEHGMVVKFELKNSPAHYFRMTVRQQSYSTTTSNTYRLLNLFFSENDDNMYIHSAKAFLKFVGISTKQKCLLKLFSVQTRTMINDQIVDGSITLDTLFPTYLMGTHQPLPGPGRGKHGNISIQDTVSKRRKIDHVHITSS